jgi:hypothetical protein
MVENSLVEARIIRGLGLVNLLQSHDFPVAAAWWLKPVEDEELTFYIASRIADDAGVGAAYERAYHALGEWPVFEPNPSLVPLGKTQIIGEQNPITADVRKVIERYRGAPPIYVARCRLGQIEAEELNIIYVANLPAPWQKVELKTAVEVDEPLSPQESRAKMMILGSGIDQVRAGWPKTSLPPGTVVNARILGSENEPNPLVLIVSLDGTRRGITHKDNTQPVQPNAPRSQQLIGSGKQ